jgi:hypothetical protein
MKKLLMLMLALCLVSFMLTVAVADEMKGKETTLQGWVTDTMCGAKGMSNDHAACVKKCAKGGAKVALVTDADKKVYTVENADALAGHEGHHVEVSAHVNGDSIHVASAKMLDQKAMTDKAEEHHQ